MNRPIANSPALIATFLMCFAGIARAADDKPTTKPAEPIIWKLEDPKTVGGLATEVWGAPQAVTEADGKGIHFNGTTDGIIVPTVPIKGWTQYSIEMLIKPDSDGPAEPRFLHIQDTDTRRATIEIRLADHTFALDTFLFGANGGLTLLDQTKRHPADKWTWLALVFKDGTMTSYIDGAKENQGPVNMSVMGDGKTSLGVRQNKVYWFKGTIREVRFSPTGLEPEKLQKAAAK